MLLGNARLGERIVDLRIDGGVIAEIGSIGTGDIDLGGRWIGPGLWDHHVHFTQWALTSRRVDLAAATSAAETAAIIDSAGGAGLVIGTGFRDALWADAPTRAVLDAATGARPAALVSADLHSVWLNSAALERFGYASHPTGLLIEGDAFAVQQQLGSAPTETIDAWAREAAADAARRGVVGIVDFEMAWNLGDWQRRIDAGHDALRIEFAVYTEHLHRAIAQGLRTGQSHGELLTMGRYKVLSDGSLNTRTAYTHDAYDDGSRGVLTVPARGLEPLMREASTAGIEPAVHAIGDRANTMALDAFQAVGCRGSIEHAQLLVDADLPRFAALGVEASVQPEHAMDDRDIADHHWAAAAGRAFALRSLLDAGATLRFGSDAPVAPLDPWLGISAAVSRSRGGRESWYREQCIRNAEALAASTRTRVDVGEPADLVVTELDPLTASGDELRGMPVAATFLAGRPTHLAL
jgi:predicted amidohydrolase YtcJ